MPDDIRDSIENLKKIEEDTKVKIVELEKVTTKTEEETKKLEALKQEQTRVLDLINKQREDKRTKEESFVERFHRESFQKAKQKIANDLGVKLEEFTPIEEAYNKLSDKPVTEGEIERKLTELWASNNASALMELHRKSKAGQEAAGTFIEGQSNSAGAGAGMGAGTVEVTLTKEDIQAAQWAGIPIDKYKKLKQEGKLD